MPVCNTQQQSLGIVLDYRKIQVGICAGQMGKLPVLDRTGTDAAAVLHCLEQ